MTRVWFGLPLLVLLACDGETSDVTDASGSTSGAAPTSDDGETTRGLPAATSSSGSQPEDEEEPGTTSTGAGALEGSSSGGGDPAPEFATPHFPLQVGLQWSYRLTRTDGTVGQDCLGDGSIHVMTITEENAGVFTRTEEPFCYFSSLAFRIEGEFVDVSSGDWYHQLLLPPAMGATWPAGGASGASYVWDDHHASYTVEAGTFEDCWRRKQQGYDVWEIYCRDVGMVESYYDAWGSNSRSELVAFDG